MKDKKFIKNLTLRTDEKLNSQILAFAENYNLSVSSAVRVLISKAFKENMSNNNL